LAASLSARRHSGHVTLDGLIGSAIVIFSMVSALAWLGPTHLDGAVPSNVDRQGATIDHAVAASAAADTAWCRELHGPRAIAVQLPDGQHRCADQDGRRLPASIITVGQRVQP